MKLFRFMSKDEFEKLINGEELANEKEHAGHTDSIGFCFMPYKEDEDIEYAYEYLSGIVTDDIVVVFETDKNNLNKSWGIYADPYGHFFHTITETEYCTTNYNKNTFKILKYGVNIDKYGLNIKWCNTEKKALDIVNKKLNKIKQEEEIKKKRFAAVNEITIEKLSDLNDFLNEIQKNDQIVEFKIRDKYYKAYLGSISMEYAYNQVKLDTSIYIR